MKAVLTTPSALHPKPRRAFVEYKCYEHFPNFKTMHTKAMTDHSADVIPKLTNFQELKLTSNS